MDLLPPHSSPSLSTALDLVINAADLDTELSRDSARLLSRWPIGMKQGGLELRVDLSHIAPHIL